MERYPDSSPRSVETSIPRKRIYHGLDENLAKQLIRKSRQQHILDSTPRDAGNRFRDEETLAEWLAQGRDVYALAGGLRLAGVVWYGEKPLPFDINNPDLPRHTFAIRMYDPYRGKGFSEAFMDDSLRDYLTGLSLSGELENFNGLWLSTRWDNEKARSVYNNYGYKHVGFVGNETIMVLPPSRIAEKIRALSSVG